jgi:hypothetical protein
MYHPATTVDARRAHEDVRRECYRLAIGLNAMLPDGREKVLAMTHLEEVMFWSNAGLARDGAKHANLSY